MPIPKEPRSGIPADSEEGRQGLPGDSEPLAAEFERHRAHLRAVAYRMLGSVTEAEDAVQESWIRLSRTDVTDVGNLRAWLTTVVARVCLDMLRTRTSRREAPLDTHVPDPVITRADKDPESDAMLADSVGLALLVVLETLEPVCSIRISFCGRRPDGRLFAVIGFTIAGGKVVEMDILADPERLSRLDLSAIGG
jgi:RNA polymerase sigma-70 factor (ECF subfamily)